MSPNRREREYARRRYEKWQTKQVAKQARRHRNRRVGAVAGSAILVVLVIFGAVYFFNRPGSGGKASAASASPTASPSASPSASAATSAGPNPCPAPPAKPANPKKWDKAPAASTAGGKTWTVTLNTSCGKIGIRLDGAKAPQATAAMIFLARNGFFDKSPCHRLTTQGIYVLQCGDPTGTGSGGPGFEYGPVENAPKNNVYPAATVAMARRGDDGKSMGSQFFLVYRDSQIPSDSAGGYTVLGEIVSGQDVVNNVAAGGVAGGGGDGEPARPISILGTTVGPG